MRTVIDGVGIVLITGREIEAFWEDMKNGIERSTHNSHGLVSPESIRNMVLKGVWGCLLASDGEKLDGAAFFEILPTETGDWLNVPFVWVDKSLKTLNRMLSETEAYAKKNGYAGVKMLTSIDKVGHWLERHDYSPRFIEYVKEV